MSAGVPIRPAVSALPAYRAGASAEGAWKLSSNENPYPPLPGVRRAITEALADANRYPDPAGAELTAALAKKFEAVPERIALGGGSVAVLAHLLGAVCEPGDEVVFAWRSFEAYPITVLSLAATPVPVDLDERGGHDLDAMRRAIGPRTRAVLVCTPNNPTGPVVQHDALAAFVAGVPENVLVLIDEAYAEYVTDPGAARGLELASEHANVAVLRTFSKAYGLAGLRVGYCIAEPGLASAARALNPPFGVSLPAQAAAVAALDSEEDVAIQVGAITRARDELAAELRGFGFAVPEAQGNFVWLPAGGRTRAWAQAFKDGGVLVRPFAAGDRHDGIRITVGLPEANSRVAEIARSLAAG